MNAVEQLNYLGLWCSELGRRSQPHLCREYALSVPCEPAAMYIMWLWMNLKGGLQAIHHIAFQKDERPF
jgi:hypothetical protein